MLNKFLDQWQSFWFRSCPPHALAIVRIAFAGYLIVEALTYLPVAAVLFSNQALTVSLWSEYLPDALKMILEPPPPIVAYAIVCIYILACIALLLGMRMRTALVILILLYFYYWQVSFFMFPSSYHRVYFFMLWGLLLSGADKTFSWRMYKEKGSIYAWEPISIFAQRLISVQMMFTYVGVGMQKAWLPAWQDGRALSMSLVGRWATPLGRWVVAQNYPFWLYSLNVDIIKIIEVMLPFMLWTKYWRWWAVAAGFMFHVGIAVLMSIWWFVALIPAYIVFWQPEEIYAWCRRRFPQIR